MAGKRSNTGRRGRRNGSEREFVSEAEDILETMRAAVADLGDADGPEPDPQLVNRLFRAAHSLKALAGLFQFDPIQDLAHRLEDVLDGLRLGRVELSAVLSPIDEAIGMFTKLLAAVGNAAAMARSEEAIADLVARIEAAARADTAAPEPVLAALELDPSLLAALTEYEEHRLREGLRRGRRITLVDVSFDLACFEEGLSELTTAIRESGEVISTLPTPGESPESQIRFSLLAASELAASELASRLEIPERAVRDVLPSLAHGSAGPPDSGPPADAPRGGEPLAMPAARLEAGELESLRSVSQTVRVDIRKLDELMNIVGELVIQRGTLSDLIDRLLAEPTTVRAGGEFAKLHKTLDRRLRELQSAVLDVRMVPLRQVFERVSRVVRRIRRERALSVALDVVGADTELDKLIVEALVDPLMHVVRNALDHAIEPADERIAAGKDPVARIEIGASQRGNHVVITVSDDGRGLDTAALRARAERLGLVAEGATLAEEEAFGLVFAPGLTTRGEVTETSGRGVGMDVVRSNLTSLGGVVDVGSSRGRGTRITMTLPITLAIIRSLIVGVGDQRFAVPLDSVLETLLVEPGTLQRSEGRELLDLRGQPLPLRRLAAEFGLPSDSPSEKAFAIVLGLGEQRMALLVDRLEGQQDTVIKPIQGPVRVLRGIAGATELGDQSAVLVLDVAGLVEDSLRRREAA
jgi:two-component system chemotaxis sensor kinase CheA